MGFEGRVRTALVKGMRDAQKEPKKKDIHNPSALKEQRRKQRSFDARTAPVHVEPLASTRNGAKAQRHRQEASGTPPRLYSSNKEAEGILRRLGACCPALNMTSSVFKNNLAIDIEQALEKAYAQGHAAGIAERR